jgi:hypothetical protein
MSIPTNPARKPSSRQERCTELPAAIHDLMSLYAQPRGGKPSLPYTKIR